MLQPQPGERIYDPTAGTGGMLISALAEVQRNGGDARTLGATALGAATSSARRRRDGPTTRSSSTS